MPTHMRRFLALSSIAALGALAGCGEQTAEVGKCTNADPDLTVQVVAIEIVDCGSDEATEKIVKEVQNRTDCDGGRLTVEVDGEQKIFCTQPL